MVDKLELWFSCIFCITTKYMGIRFDRFYGVALTITNGNISISAHQTLTYTYMKNSGSRSC